MIVLQVTWLANTGDRKMRFKKKKNCYRSSSDYYLDFVFFSLKVWTERMLREKEAILIVKIKQINISNILYVIRLLFKARDKSAKIPAQWVDF